MVEKDYIERAAAIEAMYKDAEAHPEHTFWVTQHEALRSIPAADVRPVVRCRDCKYGQGAKMDFWNEYEGIECIGGVVHRKDWFCADGEKREES